MRKGTNCPRLVSSRWRRRTAPATGCSASYTSRPCPEMRAHAAEQGLRTAMRWHLCPQVHAAGVRHPDGEAGAPVTTRRASGGDLAKTIQMPQAPRTWIRPGAGGGP